MSSVVYYAHPLSVHDTGYKAPGMDYFKEIGFAQDLGLPVIELPSAMVRRALSVEATGEALCELGYH